MQVVRRGEVYLIDIPRGRGSEVHGARPALVIQNDIGNEYSSTTIVAFMTSVDRDYDFHVQARGLPLDGPSYVQLEQLRTVSIDRLGRFVGAVDALTMEEVDRAIHLSLGIRVCPRSL